MKCRLGAVVDTGKGVPVPTPLAKAQRFVRFIPVYFLFLALLKVYVGRS